jgi:PAS domain S-box-containing protein
MAEIIDREIAELRRANAELQRRLDDAVAQRDETEAQKIAMAEVLEVINSSPGDLDPVFDAMLDRATMLCDAAYGLLWAYDGQSFWVLAGKGVPHPLMVFLREPQHPEPDTGIGRIVGGEPFVSFRDLSEYRGLSPVPHRVADLGGARSGVVVGLRKDATLIGAISVYRQEVHPFTEKQIALLQNFASQAVIAIENARLLGELRERTEDLQESLEYQTATSNVLQVISRSDSQLEWVMESLIETVTRLCQADHGYVFRRLGDRHHLVAAVGITPEFRAFMVAHPFLPDHGTLSGRVALEHRVVHIEDAASDPEYTWSEAQQRGNLRTGLGVPLLRDETLIGIIVLYRSRVEHFTEKQVALATTFADQAVIAMENARLITETREALEQQTATAEVLGVINSSPGDLRPVFEAMLEKALRLCGASFGELRTYDGKRFVLAATHGAPSDYVEYYQRHDTGRYSPGTGPAQLLAGERVVHIPDLIATEPYLRGDPDRRAIVDLGRARAYVLVPLLLDDTVRGFILIYRREPGSFSDKQIALLQNFAAQAVIAMENARLITETREALEQQTATAEVLGVINSSPGNLPPVFDAILDKALRLCEAAFGIMNTYDGSRLHTVALRNVPAGLREVLLASPVSIEPESPPMRLVNGEDVVLIDDLDNYEARRTRPRGRALVELGGARSFIMVPLRKDGRLLGTVAAYRQEVRPFGDKQTGLLQNFAAQAVIAMENARLITETREALEQQTATAEVLGVINSSPGDLAPVFEAMLEKAVRLCEFPFAALWTYDGERFAPVAFHKMPPAFEAYVREHTPPGIEALREAPGPIHLADVLATELAHRNPAFTQKVQELGGVRTLLLVPLRKDNVLVGTFVAYRQEVRPFTEKQIALLQNFAAQAVIAMENARLITETREALEQQTATAEVLGVINSSPGDLGPVFDAMLQKAMRLCDGVTGFLWTFDGPRAQLSAWRGVSAEFVNPLRARGEAGTHPLLRRLMDGEHLIQINLAEHEWGSAGGKGAVEAGVRTLIWIALLKDGRAVGAFVVGRLDTRPFTEKQIALLQNFAAQAVIAMENARLINETREALEQQTATAEVLQVINSSPGDLTPVFDAILEKAHSLCGVAFGSLQLYEGGKLRAVAVRAIAADLADLLREPMEPLPGSRASRLIAGERFVQTPDILETTKQFPDDPRLRLSAARGLRTGLFVPLRKEAEFLGYISAFRDQVRPFTEKEIALLENFAAQAVIAMDNARLLNEIRQRQAELRVTFDNMGDGVAMFDAYLRLAAWNLNFRQILGLTNEFLERRPTSTELIRYLAQHGEFGTVDIEAEVHRLSERMDQQWSAERSRPDGRVIEVRNNPVPGGGFVLIYSDITERKRSEAEIRAARDAAEAAYRDLKAAQASLVQAEKMASLGQLTAGIAHEIKNPLNFVNNFAGLSVELLDELKETAAPALTALPEPDRAEVDETIELLTNNLEKIAEHGRRADGIVKSMLEHSRGTTGERRSVDLNALVDEALNLAYHGGRAQDQSFNITLERDYAHDIPPIELVPQDITRVCLNLFGNGFYAATKRLKESDDPKFKPTLKVTTRDLGDAVEIRARDNGVGIPAEIRDKLFQPFFTTKPTGEGTGLGLSISYDIVTQEHGGTIEVDSKPGEFTEFAVRLPRQQAGRAAA